MYYTLKKLTVVLDGWITYHTLNAHDFVFFLPRLIQFYGIDAIGT